jgi:hypothetical protein
MKWLDLFKRNDDDLHTRKYGDYTLEANVIDRLQVTVKAYLDNENVGQAVFIQHPENIDLYYSEDSFIKPEHRRKHIASAMYEFAKDLGFTIIPAPGQTDDGKAFWKSRK